MPEYLPTQIQPIIPGSRYYSESTSSYATPSMGVSGTLGDLAGNVNTVQGNAALILALNRLLGTAPARAVKPTVGIPFVTQAEPGITPNVPDEAAYTQAVEIMKGAQIPRESSPTERVQRLAQYMQKLGIPLQ